MRTVIHKFGLARVGRQTIMVPGFVRVMDVQLQQGALVMWCAVLEGSRESVTLVVDICWTGHAIPEDITLFQHYVATVQDRHEMVLHIFARGVAA